MAGLIATAGTGLAVFAGTNIDDLLVLTVLFVSARGGRPRRWEIVTGQILGFTALLAASAMIAIVLGAVPDRWIRLLGMVPIAVGLVGLWRAARRTADADPPVLAGSLWSIAGLTIADGADNLSVYPPLLRTLGIGQAITTGVTFYLGVALLCLAGARLAAHQGIAARLARVQHWLGPLVFVGLGVIILLGVL